MSSYPFHEIEVKWQKYWADHQTYKVTEDPSYPKEKRRYVLDMFPYPSGAGLHVGHPEGYTATDIYTRYLKMKGYNVLHPMGFDSFGLPAENYAIKTGTHPKATTERTSSHSPVRSRVWDSATTGTGRFPPVNRNTTNGPNGFSSSCTKRTRLRDAKSHQLVSELQNGIGERGSERRQVRAMRRESGAEEYPPMGIANHRVCRRIVEGPRQTRLAGVRQTDATH